jgi:hypothetical protein
MPFDGSVLGSFEAPCETMLMAGVFEGSNQRAEMEFWSKA